MRGSKGGGTEGPDPLKSQKYRVLAILGRTTEK